MAKSHNLTKRRKNANFYMFLYAFICFPYAFHTLSYAFHTLSYAFHTLSYAFYMLSYTFKRKKAKRPLLLLAKRPKSRTQGNVRLSRCAAGKNNFLFKQCLYMKRHAAFLLDV